VKINVLHVCDKLGRKGSSIHGVSRLFSWWWPLFDKDRFDVGLINLRHQDGANQFLQEKGVKLKSLGKGKFNFLAYRDIVRMIHKEEIDVLHLHGYGASNIGIVASHITGIKCIVHEHFVDPVYPVYQRPFDYLFGRYSDKGIAVSQSVKMFMVDRRHIPKHKIDIIYNGAPINDFVKRDDDAIQIEKKRLGIPSNVPVIATIGRMDEQKGNLYFIEAAKILLQKGCQAKFILAGDGPLLEYLKSKCKQLDISDHIIFTGHYKDIPLLQSLIDIQVFPSLWEGTPLTIFEAFAMGLPVVSTNVDGLGEVVKNNVTGLVVPPRDGRAIADRILALINNPDKSKRLAINAHKESATYDIKRCVHKIESIYSNFFTEVPGKGH